jgi:hypothetical protein
MQCLTYPRLLALISENECSNDDLEHVATCQQCSQKLKSLIKAMDKVSGEFSQEKEALVKSQCLLPYMLAQSSTYAHRV